MSAVISSSPLRESVVAAIAASLAALAIAEKNEIRDDWIDARIRLLQLEKALPYRCRVNYIEPNGPIQTEACRPDNFCVSGYVVNPVDETMSSFIAKVLPSFVTGVSVELLSAPLPPEVWNELHTTITTSLCAPAAPKMK